MLSTADLHIVADGLAVLVPMPDRQACWNNDPGSFPTAGKMGFDRVLVYVMCHRWQEVNFS